jgi:hypothetical protein
MNPIFDLVSSMMPADVWLKVLLLATPVVIVMVAVINKVFAPPAPAPREHIPRGDTIEADDRYDRKLIEVIRKHKKTGSQP